MQWYWIINGIGACMVWRAVIAAVIAVVVVMVMARSMSAGTNLDQRQKYWEKELAASGLKPGDTKDQIQAFATKHGQRALHCYQNGRRQDVCDFEDAESKGGSRNLPMRLAVVFVMRGDSLVSWDFYPTSANKE